MRKKFRVVKPQIKKPIPPKKPRREKINPKEMLLNYRLQTELNKQGVVDYTPQSEGGILNINSDYLFLPHTLTDTPAFVLGEHLNAFTQQKTYYRTLFGQLQCIVEECRRAYDNIRVVMYRELCKDKLSETAKDLIINNDPEVKPYYEKYVEAKLKLSMLERSIENTTDSIFLLSREISRRESDFNEEKRLHNKGVN